VDNNLTGAQATAANASAFGAESSATGENSSAFGAGATAGHVNSTAIGQGATTTRDNQMMLGTSTSTYTLAGLAAPVGSTRFVTTDSGGNLAYSQFGPDSIATLGGSITSLSSEIGQTRTEARAGTALALATAGLRYDDRAGKLSLAGGFGHFKGQSGLALGLGYNTSEDFRMNAAVSATTGQGDIGVSVGASWTLN
jgi:autotransporter adhesin